MQVTPSRLDIEHYQIIRKNIEDFLKRVSLLYARNPGRLLDIAPQVHAGARPYFTAEIEVETFDMTPNSGCTHIGDICDHNSFLGNCSFDYVVCTEVLEHTLRPWDAVKEIHRILKPGGVLFLTVPFNFRIHGPLPDCWRFTEHGLRSLLTEFEIREIDGLETPDRPLMPIHYTVVATKKTESP